MEVGDEHEDVSRTGEAEISENLDATANEGGSGVASEGNECASFDGIQCEVFNVNIGSQSPEAISLNGDEVRKEAGKVVEALIISFEEDKLEHELASASMRLEQLMPEAEMVIGGEEEGEVLIVEKGISTEWHEDESQNPDNKSVGPNSADMDTQSEEHSTNHLHIEKSVSPALSVLDSEKESLSSLDPDIIHGHDCNEETLPDQFLGVKCDILEALPHLDSRDEMKALVDTVSNMGEKAEAQTDTLIIKGWGEVGDSKGKNENVEALTEEGLYEAGFVTISPLACGLEGSAISADSSGNISEAKQGFSKSAVLAVEPETIGVDLNLRNPVIELSEEENDSQQSDFMESVKAQGVSQLGEAWRPTAAAEEEAGADQQPAAAAALPDSDAHPVHRDQLPAEEHAHAHKCEIDAEREGMVENKDKGGELKEWLLVKEKEFDEILGHGEDNGRSCNMTGTAVGIDCDIPKDGFMKACEIEVMACKMSQSNTQAEARPGERDISVEGSTFITETTTDLMDELELQSEILRQITEKASVVSADNDIGEKVRGLEEHDGEIQRKKGKTSKAGSKSMKTKKKIPKSPLLKRSEIKACIDLHNACENADILQEIIQPAISFGSTHKALEQEVVCRNKEVEGETTSKEEVDEPVFVEEVTWQDPPQPRPRKPVFFAGKPRRQPIRVVGLALNQFSHFSGCHVNVSQDTSCVTAFIHAAAEIRVLAVAAHFSTPGMAWFPWKTISLLLLIGTAAIINLDMERSGGSFKASNTGQFLSDLGQYERVMGAGSWVMVTTKQGRQWVEVTLPPYLAHSRKVAGPYLEVAAAKINEAGAIAKLGLERVREASKLGLARLEAAVPGLGVRMEEFGTEASRLGVLAVAKGREVAVNAREGLALLLSGKVDWSAVRIQLAEAVEVAQKQLLAAANYVQLQLKQLVK